MFNIQWNPNKKLEEIEREAIEIALKYFEGNRTHAAHSLGISPRTMRNRIEKFGLPQKLPGGHWKDQPHSRKKTL